MPMSYELSTAFLQRELPAAYVQRYENDFSALGRSAFGKQTSAISAVLSEISLGTIRYPTRRPVNLTYLPGKNELLANGLSPAFTGNGPTVEEARLDLLMKLSIRFQELVVKREFEMSADEKRDWALLDSVIDSTVYRNTQPIFLRQLGVISKARPIPSQITWDDGSKEDIGIEKVADPDFFGLKIGQPIEAFLRRDPLTFQILSLEKVNRHRSRQFNITAEELLGAVAEATKGRLVGWESLKKP